MNKLDKPTAEFRKSTFSGADNPACVEVGFVTAEVMLRDSKHKDGPVLRFTPEEWNAFLAGVKVARERIVARTDEDRQTFLRRRGFGKAETAKVIATVLDEEGHPPESLFDFVQGITALARAKPHQDTRLELEGRARALLARAS